MVDLAFSTQVKAYLGEKGISETRIQAGNKIEFNYMEEDAEQNPGGDSLKAAPEE